MDKKIMNKKILLMLSLAFFVIIVFVGVVLVFVVLGSIYVEWLWVSWLIGLPIYFHLFYVMLINRKSLIKNVTIFKLSTPFIVFQITTVGGMEIVQQNIERIREICSKIGYDKYRIDVITEVDEDFDKATVVVVPKKYATLNKAQFKARALHYAIKHRDENGENTDKVWLFHLDDESMLTEQCLLSILSHIQNNGSLISEGLIIYPNAWNEGSKLVKYLDCVRPTFCYECLNMLRSGEKPEWLHGSNLLVRADIEKSVGWDFGRGYAEDSLFGYKAHEKYGSSVFGWHGGVIEEQSPYTFKDYLKQRRRWFIGSYHNLIYLNLKEKIKVSYRLFSWVLGILGVPVSIIAIFFSQSIPIHINMILLVNCFILVLIYQLGLWLNTSKLQINRIREHLTIFVLTPLLLLLEATPAIYAIFFKPKNFDVVRK